MKQVFNVACFVTILLAPVIVFGQKTFISLGPELALPAHYNQSNNNRGIGIGGSVRLESSWDKHISGIATVGYLSFAKTNPLASYPTYTNQVNETVIQLGIKYYTKPKTVNPTGVFFTGEAGLMPTSTHITYTNGSKQNRKESGLSVALGSGYQYKNIECSFRLQYNLSAVGYHVYYYNFRLAYSFLNRKK